MNTPSSIVINQPGGSLDLYIESDAKYAGAATIVNPPPSPATALKTVGIRTALIALSSDSKVYGLIYGPGATANITSGTLYGAITARVITIVGSVHLDASASSNKSEGIVY